jgi:hypothetical protein
MEFTFVKHGGQAYIEWSISDVIRMSGEDQKKDHPYVVRALILPSDARAFAQCLIDAAHQAETLIHSDAP